MKKREPGLDLIRCTAFFFVVLFHSFLQNGFYNEAQTGLLMLFYNSVRWLSVSCIGLFLMLTGYLKSGKTDIISCYRDILPILFGYVLACAVSIPVRHFLLGEPCDFFTWVSRFIGFRGVLYGWYVQMYIGLMLILPFVNLALGRLKSPKQFVVLCSAMLVLTAVPGVLKKLSFISFWRSLYPLTYYFLGAAVKKYQPKINPFFGLAVSALISVCLGTVTSVSTDGNLSQARKWEFPDLWICMTVFFLFLSLYRLKPAKPLSEILAFLSGGCFGGYLLSHLLDAWAYSCFPSWKNPQDYPKLFVSVTVPVFLVSVFSGKALSVVVSAACKRQKNRADEPLRQPSDVKIR